MTSHHNMDPTSGKVIASNMLMGVVGDEDTCAGFALAGIGEYRGGQVNFIVTDSRSVNVAQLEADFQRLVRRPDIAIIVVTESVAGWLAMPIRQQRRHLLPAIVEVPDRHQGGGGTVLDFFATASPAKTKKSIDKDDLRLIQDKAKKTTNIFSPSDQVEFQDVGAVFAQPGVSGGK